MQRIMLSELQQRNVWEGWLGAEIRGNYFADLCQSYLRTQRVITWSTLIASSGAAATVLATLPDGLEWARLSLLVVTAALSLWALVTNYGKRVTDCSDLHFRWNMLASDYEALWGNMYAATAQEQLASL